MRIHVSQNWINFVAFFAYNLNLHINAIFSKALHYGLCFIIIAADQRVEAVHKYLTFSIFLTRFFVNVFSKTAKVISIIKYILCVWRNLEMITLRRQSSWSSLSLQNNKKSNYIFLWRPFIYFYWLSLNWITIEANYGVYFM